MKFTDIRSYFDKHPTLKRWIVNKYTITCLVFGVFFLFIGDQSLVKQIKRQRHAHRLERQIEESRRNIATYQRELEVLTNTDSLERYAREQYHMHAPGEKVYIVK